MRQVTRGALIMEADGRLLWPPPKGGGPPPPPPKKPKATPEDELAKQQAANYSQAWNLSLGLSFFFCLMLAAGLIAQHTMA
jgi:hypothetical protein